MKVILKHTAYVKQKYRLEIISKLILPYVAVKPAPTVDYYVVGAGLTATYIFHFNVKTSPNNFLIIANFRLNQFCQ